MTPWVLPETAEIGGTVYKLNTDFRDVLEIIGYLNDPDTPEHLRWRIAIALFFDTEDPEAEIPAEHQQEAAEYLASFLTAGEVEEKPGPQLLDWEQDATEIIADINKVAGYEVRAASHLHWWTFLAWFHGIGEGHLSMIVSIRDKLRRGKKLEKWEQEYYREHKSKVDIKKRYSAEELAEQERLKKLLGG